MKNLSPFIQHDIYVRLDNSHVKLSFVSDHKDVLIGDLQVEINHFDGEGWNPINADRFRFSTSAIWENTDG